MTSPSQTQVTLAREEESPLQTAYFLPIMGPVLDQGGQETDGDQSCGKERLY